MSSPQQPGATTGPDFVQAPVPQPGVTVGEVPASAQAPAHTDVPPAQQPTAPSDPSEVSPVPPQQQAAPDHPAPADEAHRPAEPPAPPKDEAHRPVEQPAPPADEGHKPAEPPAPPAEQPAPGVDHYTVAEGDSLSSIAAEHGTDWQHVYAANQDAVGANPDVIQPGTTLTIPGHDLSQDGSQDTSGIDLAHPEPHAGQQPGETPAPAPEPGPHDEHPADAGHDDPHEIGFEHEPAPENTDHPDIDHDADHSDDGWS